MAPTYFKVSQIVALDGYRYKVIDVLGRLYLLNTMIDTVLPVHELPATLDELRERYPDLDIQLEG